MQYSISFDAADLIAGLNLPMQAAIGQAVEATAVTAQAAWRQTVLDVRGVWYQYKVRYADSIRVEYSPDRMAARIYTDDPMATPIETGIPARDLKQMLSTSLKTRVVKSGKNEGRRYLIIPFRHNTPGHNALARSMPSDIYAQAKQLTASRVTSNGFRPNDLQVHAIGGGGARQIIPVRSRTYAWGGRLDGDHIAARFRGLVRFNTSSGKQKSSDFFTFRVMGEWSHGWVTAAQPGRYIVRSVSEQAQVALNESVAAAIASVS